MIDIPELTRTTTRPSEWVDAYRIVFFENNSIVRHVVWEMSQENTANAYLNTIHFLD